MKNLNEVRKFVRQVLSESLPPEKQLTMTDMHLCGLLFKAFDCKTEDEVGRIFREEVFGDPDYVPQTSNVPPGAMM